MTGEFGGYDPSLQESHTAPQGQVEQTGGQETINSDEQLKPVVDRLLFDTRLTEAPKPTMKFDPYTGEDLRGRPNESLRRTLLPQAETNMGTALGLQSAKFNPYTGEAIPPRTEEVTSPGGGTEQRLSLPNCETRLSMFRKIAGVRVEDARQRGVAIPRFDGQTGQPIPQDSLRALEAAQPKQPQTETYAQAAQREREEDMADLQMGLDALARLKAMKAGRQ